MNKQSDFCNMKSPWKYVGQLLILEIKLFVPVLISMISPRRTKQDILSAVHVGIQVTGSCAPASRDCIAIWGWQLSWANPVLFVVSFLTTDPNSWKNGRLYKGLLFASCLRSCLCRAAPIRSSGFHLCIAFAFSFARWIGWIRTH